MNENLVLRQIVNSDSVIQHFGYWPNFHDAEIKQVLFEANPGFYPSVTLVISAFETTTKTDDRGYYQRTKACEIEVQFTGIKEIEFDGFSHQNVIFSLEFEKQDDDLTCTVEASVGLEVYIVAQAAAVVSLQPIT